MKRERACAVCGEPCARADRGRRRRYCSRSCQARAYRARRAATPPRRPPRPRHLTAVGIVRAAIELADHEGLDAVTMRRLATELGVATASLYRYFPDRDTLLSEMAELTLAQAPTPPPADDWRTRLTAEARAEWQLYQRHPWMLAVLAQTRPPMGPALLDVLERSFAALDRPGMSGESMLAIYLSISALVQGLALLPGSEHRPVGTGSAAAEQVRAQVIDLVTAESHPTLFRHFTGHADGLDVDFDRLLDHGLALLLDGVARRYFPAGEDRDGVQ
ncbi:TetR/AcrR family transcriptional regulator [Nocardia sp. CDC159]|uniref:TetR/AcrR family transcriptional regulator n=1 Tax=Nocardia pulmonis TaxID=2951408 RepID=A0A9X2E3E6_9NOCA|nr:MULTISPECIES: TetR/AcrR family transcriptional regulator [Nocardia]MCM6773417.1 TetR/AcrR family transcriptional regulator [Nocardia pulmonis]MCM6786304.1 TetR/AcrR family transcriptional regulator [Nocardia sp. CDC159]